MTRQRIVIGCCRGWCSGDTCLCEQTITNAVKQNPGADIIVVPNDQFEETIERLQKPSGALRSND